MDKKCFNPIQGDLERFKEEVTKGIKKVTTVAKKRKLQKALEDITEEDMIATMSIAIEEYGLPQDFHFSDDGTIKSDNYIIQFRKNITKIFDVLIAETTEKEKKLKTVSEIGNAGIILYGKGKNSKGRELPQNKNTPREHPSTLYIFTENLQAYDGDTYKTDYEKIDNPSTNVKNTAAALRTDSDGNRNPNTLALVVKKNAEMQEVEGRWVTSKASDSAIEKAHFSIAERAEFNKLLQDFMKKLKSVLYPNDTYKWARTANNNYEVSTKGDSRFSALNAKFKEGTKFTLYINGKPISIDASNRTIEDIYQNDLKKSGKGKAPSKNSLLFSSKQDDGEHRSYYEAYLPLWRLWAEQNPELIKELRTVAKNKVLTDSYATTTVNQARALSDILAGTVYNNVWLPETIALDNAGLPMELAKDLQVALEELGITSSILESNMTKGKDIDSTKKLYGLRLDNVKTSSKRTQKDKAESAKLKEARQSLEAERPESDDIELKNINIVMKVFPNLYQLKTRIEFLTNLLEDLIDAQIQHLTTRLDSYNDEDLTLVDAEIKRGLHSESTQDRYRAAFSYKTETGQTLLDVVLNNLNYFIQDYSVNDPQVIPVNLIHDFCNRFYYAEELENTYIAREYLAEVEENPNKKIKAETRAKRIITFLSQLNREDGLKDAMLERVFDTLAERRGIQLSLAEDVSIATKQETEDYEQDSEGSVEAKSEQLFVQWKVKDPIDTASAKIKELLSKAYQVDLATKKYARNEFGTRIPIKWEVTFYKLIESFAEMNDSTDFVSTMEGTLVKYPWFKPIYQELKQDSDLRNEFYRVMRNTLVSYAVMSPYGRIQFKNNSYTLTIFLDNITKNYESGLALSDKSLYTQEGTPNTNNIQFFKNLFDTSKNNSELTTHIKEAKDSKEKSALRLKYAPLGYAINTLSDRDSTVSSLKNVLTTLSNIENEFSLENILRSIGIDTTDFDLNVLLPYVQEETLDNIETIRDLDAIWPAKTRLQVLNIIQGYRTIVNGFGSNAQDHLTENYRKVLRRIGTNLVSTSQSYTSISFWDGEHRRNSYTKPDAVSKFFNIVKKIDTPTAVEKGTRFLEQEFLRFDFFKRMPLVRALHDNVELRKEVRKIDLLSSAVESSRKDRQQIGRLSKTAYVKTLMAAFESETETDSKIPMAYYGNPLYSDVEAIQLFRLPKIVGNNFKSEIIYNLAEVAIAELDRIIAYRRSNENEEVKIEFFNDKKGRAGQFCMLPFLNENIEELVQLRTKKYTDYGSTFNEDNRELLNALTNFISEHLANKFTEWESSFTNNEKQDILTLLKTRAKYDKNVIKDNEETGTDSEEDDDQEDEELKKEREADENTNSSTIEDAELTDIHDRMERFYYNDYYIRTQMLAVLTGDQAFFKNARDQIKRAKQEVYSSGEKIYALDEEGNPLTERVLYLQDKQTVSKAFQSIRELLTNNVSPALQNQIEGFFSGYLDITSTDGQGFRDPNSIRTLFKAMGGRWTNQMENAFNDLKAGRLTLDCWNTLINQIKPLLATSEAKIINDRLEKVVVQHKNSEYMLTALYSVLNSAFNHSAEYRALQHFMEVHKIDAVQFHSVVKTGGFSFFNLNYSEAKFNEEKNNGLAYKHFTDSIEQLFKLGKIDQKTFKELKNTKITSYKALDDVYRDLLGKGIISYALYKSNFLDRYDFKEYENENTAIKEEQKLRKKLLKMSDEELDKYLQEHPKSALASLEKQFRTYTEEHAVHTLPLEDIMFMQPDADHMTDAEGLKGSQKRNIVIADLPDYGDGLEGRRYAITVGNETHLYTHKEMAEYYDALIAYPTIDAYARLQSEYRSPRKLKQSLLKEMRKNAKYGEDVKKAISLEDKDNVFKVPFNSPTLRNKMIDLLLSRFKNNIQRQKIKGGNAVLVTAYSTNLQTIYKEGKPVAMQCYLPAYTRDFLEDYLIPQSDGSWLIDFEKLKENNEEEILKLIGYRIPTEQKYSMFPLQIVGFNPEIAGATITLPDEAVTMSGFDFDIDKLFLMIKEYQRSRYGSKLGLQFFEWAQKNQKPVSEELLDKVLYKNPETGQYEERTQSFIAEEVKYLYDNSPVFKEFYDTLPRKNMKYRPLKPKIYRDKDGRVDLLKTVRMNYEKDPEIRRKTRNNMYIDLTYNILTSTEGATLMTQPANYDDCKLGSRMNMILDNPVVLKKFYEQYKNDIKNYGIYEFLDHFAYITSNGKVADTPDNNRVALDEFYEESAPTDEPCDIGFVTDSFLDLMAGRALIGIMAVNSSKHYKLQFVDVKLADPVKFNIKMPNSQDFVSIVQVNPMYNPINGVLTSYYLSQLQAASPDNGKDPVLGKLGISIDTASQTCYMASIGIPPELIGIFNKADDIRDYYNYSKLNSDRIEELDYQNLDIKALTDAIFKHRLGQALSVTEQNTLYAFSMWWERCILEPANFYQEASAFIRADSPNGALSVDLGEALLNILKVEKVKYDMASPDYPFIGMDKAIDLDLDPVKFMNEYGLHKDALMEAFRQVGMTRLQAFYSCGIKGASVLVKDLIPEFSAPFINMIKKISNMRNGNMNLELIKNLIKDYSTFALAPCPLFNEGDMLQTRNYYVHDFPMKAKAFLEEKDKSGNYTHEDVRSLILMKMLSITDEGIKFKNLGGKMSKDARTYYSDSLVQLFRHPDKTVRDFGVDLLRYSYFENGQNYNHSDFGTLFPVEILDSIPEYFESISTTNEKLLNNDQDMIENIIAQFFMNHIEAAYFLPKQRVSGYKYNSNTKLLTIPNSDMAETLLQYVDPVTNSLAYKPFIRMYLKKNNYFLFRLKEVSPKGIVYEALENNWTGMPFYDPSSSAFEIPFSELKNKGKVISVESVIEAQKKEEQKAAKQVKKVDAKEPSTERSAAEGEIGYQHNGITVLNYGGTVNVGTQGTEIKDLQLPATPIEEESNLQMPSAEKQEPAFNTSEEKLSVPLRIPKDNSEPVFKVPVEKLDDIAPETDPDKKVCSKANN